MNFTLYNISIQRATFQVLCFMASGYCIRQCRSEVCSNYHVMIQLLFRNLTRMNPKYNYIYTSSLCTFGKTKSEQVNTKEKFILGNSQWSRKDSAWELNSTSHTAWLTKFKIKVYFYYKQYPSAFSCILIGITQRRLL